MVFNENGPEKKMKTGRIRELKVKAELHVKKKSSVDSSFLNAHSNQVLGMSYHVIWPLAGRRRLLLLAACPLPTVASSAAEQSS